MKTLPWISVTLMIVCVIVWFRPHEQPPAEIRIETKIKTVVKVETLYISSPMAPLLTIWLTDTIHIGDTVVHREQTYYKDSLYQLWVSGYRPRLDSLHIFPRTVYQTVTNDVYHIVKPKKKRWGFGVQAGYGYPSGWYIGIGGNYNLWQW